MLTEVGLCLERRATSFSKHCTSHRPTHQGFILSEISVFHRTKMPSLVIETNVESSVIPEKFFEEMTSLIAEMLGKPESFVAVHVKPGQLMSFGGSKDTAALCTLSSVGKLGVEENKQYTLKLMEKINKDLGIPKDRMYINFNNLARGDCGWNDKTFA